MIENLSYQRWETLFYAIFAGIFIFFVFIYATGPIADNDFWWHLKTGEIMVQNGGLLQSDPFNFTSDGIVSAIERVILKGYWLWQLMAYALYSLLGFNGISLLNFFTALAMAGVVTRQMRREGVGDVLTILLLTLGFSLVRNTYYLERPQVVSFLLAAILIAQLARVRDGGRLSWPLPLLMVFWANIHAGFVFGDIVLVCFVVGAVIEYRQDLSRLRHIILWAVIGIGASLINPNGALVFGELMSFSSSSVNEFQNTWVKFQLGNWFVVILWLLIALYVFGLWLSRRVYWPELVVALFLAYSSVSYMRNVAFFAVAMLPAIGLSLQQGMTLRSISIPPRWGFLLICIAAAGLLWQTNVHWQKMRNEGPVSSIFPDKSTQFILDSGLQGRMLNGYNVGGYLLWRLYPQHRIFIDGRGLEAEVFSDWLAMTSASLQEEGGRKEFEVLLERYDIDYVVSDIQHQGGRLFSLLKFLMVKAEWIPVYVDQQSFILVRDSQKNVTVIERYRMNKNDFSNKIIGFLTARCKGWPTEVSTYVPLAEMLIFVGRYDEAEKRLTEIARLQPDHEDLPALRNQLDVLKNAQRTNKSSR